MSADTDLIESIEIGGSFLELIEFSVDRKSPDGQVMKGRYGVNVAKVREVVRMPTINPQGSTPEGIAGIFELRSVPIPAVNLAAVLGETGAEISADQQIIVVEFSNRRAGFIVSSTKRIRRIAWEKVLAPPNDKSSFITGMILLEENEFLFILDMERILNVLDDAGKQTTSSAGGGTLTTEDLTKLAALTAQLGSSPPKELKHRILVVDDSQLILDTLTSSFNRAGYNVETARDGIHAMEALEKSTDESAGFDLIVTDVEMPKMDGITLVKNIRGHSLLSHIPVVFHTSLSGDATVKAGQDAGADAYVVKNDINALLEMAKKFLKSSGVSVAV